MTIFFKVTITNGYRAWIFDPITEPEARTLGETIKKIFPELTVTIVPDGREVII